MHKGRMKEQIQDGSELTGSLRGHSLVAMPRPPRLQFEGALYHAYTRGNRREKTFLDDSDYKEFEDGLLDYADRENISLYAWCLMPNHFHLLLETPQANLSVFMQRQLTRYARYFNRRHKYVGHVFQGRYEAILCDRESYFLELVRYIHLNPYRVKNKKWKVPETGWPWSSHRYYLHGNEPQAIKPFVHTVLRRFGDDIEIARQRYERFVGEGLKEGNWEDFYQIRDRKYVGNEGFVEEMRRRAGQDFRTENPGCGTLD
jgi:putative transposase